MIVDRSLAICGLSRRAEKLLGCNESTPSIARSPICSCPADTGLEATRLPHSLSAVLITAAANRDAAVEDMVLRPADEFGVRFTAKIGPCGPTPSALVVLDLG